MCKDTTEVKLGNWGTTLLTTPLKREFPKQRQTPSVAPHAHIADALPHSSGCIHGTLNVESELSMPCWF